MSFDIALSPPSAGTLGAGLELCEENSAVQLQEKYQAAILATSGLVSYWPLNTDLNDIKGTNHGCGGNIDRINFSRGTGSLYLKGSPAYADFGNPASLQITGALTIRFRFKVTNNSVFLVGKGGASAWGDVAYVVTINGSNKMEWDVYLSGASGGSVVSTVNVNTGNWMRGAVVFSPSTFLQIYINGGLDNTSTTGIPASIQNKAVPFCISKDFVNNNRFITDGNVDDVAIYNTALDATTIAALDATTDYSITSPILTRPVLGIPARTILGLTIPKSGTGNAKHRFGLNGGAMSAFKTIEEINTPVADGGIIGAPIIDRINTLALDTQFNSNGAQTLKIGQGYVTVDGLPSGGTRSKFSQPMGIRAGIN